jgi:hypothetical protein
LGVSIEREEAQKYIEVHTNVCFGGWGEDDEPTKDTEQSDRMEERKDREK